MALPQWGYPSQTRQPDVGHVGTHSLTCTTADRSHSHILHGRVDHFSSSTQVLCARHSTTCNKTQPHHTQAVHTVRMHHPEHTYTHQAALSHTPAAHTVHPNSHHRHHAALTANTHAPAPTIAVCLCLGRAARDQSRADHYRLVPQPMA